MSGPENGPEYARFPLTVKKGAVSAKWKYKADHRELPPESNPRFIFSAHSAWCNYAKSSNSLEVKLIRPEITKAEWQDAEGNSTSKGLVGQPLKLVAETKDMEGGVTFWIYDENRREVASLGADIVDGRAEAQWTYHWSGEVLKAKPKYTFGVTGNRCRKVESGEVEIGAKIDCHITDIFDNPYNAIPFTLINNDEKIKDGKVDSDGNIKEANLIPSDIYMILSDKIENGLQPKSGTSDNNQNIIEVSEADLDKIKIKMSLDIDNLVIINPDTAPASF